MTYLKAIFITIFLTISLAACAGKTKPPTIMYDDFSPAVKTAPPEKPVKIVTVPEPLPLPGQLKPMLQISSKSMEEGNPKKRVTKANRLARVEPEKDHYLNAMQVYPFTKGALYQLYASPGKVSDITLQAGENLIAVSAGDTVRWVVGNTTSGEGRNEQVHIFIKPTARGLASNLVITTNRRTYYVEMTSHKETYMASLSWHYPLDELMVLNATNTQVIRRDAEIITAGIDIKKLRFRYQITGDAAPWRPKRVFDDGRKVYIQFPSGIMQGEAPPLFVIGIKGKAQLVNYRMRGTYYIVDRLFAVAELRLGEDPQQIVRISRKNGAS
ncbi:MAG: P-type conjugative transfer protein TrbG [Opitutaceae bacterium]|nr:P-type conjugative transfer protein TrbG [Opitutaceae bacterium]